MKRADIGLFGRVTNNNFELCSDSLFHSLAHFTRSHEGNREENEYIYFNTFSRCYIVGKVYCMYNACIKEQLLICGPLYTVGTESIQTPLNFSLFVILQPFAKII